MLKADNVRLLHMIDAANEALSFVRGKSRTELDADRRLTLALVKSIEIIGEAASRTSAEFRAQSPEVPWADLVAMRNRLIHAYFDVNLDIVWHTITRELPPLVKLLEQLATPGDLQ